MADKENPMTEAAPEAKKDETPKPNGHAGSTASVALLAASLRTEDVKTESEAEKKDNPVEMKLEKAGKHANAVKTVVGVAAAALAGAFAMGVFSAALATKADVKSSRESLHSEIKTIESDLKVVAETADKKLEEHTAKGTHPISEAEIQAINTQLTTLNVQLGTVINQQTKVEADLKSRADRTDAKIDRLTEILLKR